MTHELPDLPEVPEQALITDPAQFDALNSALRVRILKVSQEPVSVREIGELLGVPVTRLYYHVSLLEQAGFLRVVHTRKSGARLEKLYRVAGKTITAGPELAKNVSDAGAAARALAAIVIEPARVEAEAALTNRFEGDERPLDISRSLGVLSPTEVERFGSRLRDLVEEMMEDREDSEDPQARTYAFTYTLLPSDLPSPTSSQIGDPRERGTVSTEPTSAMELDPNPDESA